MEKAIERLSVLQRAISQRNNPEAIDAYVERLYFCEVRGLLYVEFYGHPFFKSFTDFLDVLSSAETSAHLKSLAFWGPNVGANGIRNWDLTPLAESNVVFPELTSIFIEPTAPEHHNRSIVAEDYGENGVLAQLLAKAPQLESLTTPSAPDASFFDVGQRPLRHLRVDAGYDTQNFILNLSKSYCFPDLRVLDYGDYNERYMEDYPNGCTPFEHYRALIESQAMSSAHTFILRNSILSLEELGELKKLRRELSLLNIQSYGVYVR